MTSTSTSIQRILHQPPGEKTVLPLMSAIGLGFAVFVLMSVIPTALGFVSYGLGMGALVALSLAGLSWGYRTGILSILGATFVALLPAALAVGGTDDLKTARRITVAEISVVDAPARTNAQVLIFSDVRVATDFTVTWTTRRPSGQELHYAMAPLVPTDWQRSTPVPAWRVCSGGDADWCPWALSQPVRATQRVSAADEERYRSSLAEMTKRFGLTSAPGAPLLQLTTPPSQRAEAAMTGVIFMPILGFVAWLLGLLLWRGVRRLRHGAAG